MRERTVWRVDVCPPPGRMRQTVGSRSGWMAGTTGVSMWNVAAKRSSNDSVTRDLDAERHDRLQLAAVRGQLVDRPTPVVTPQYCP